MLLSLFFFSSFVAHSAGLLDQMIHIAWKNDPMLPAQESRITAARQDKIRRFLPNDPQIMWSTADNASWHSYGASLNVGLPGKAFALAELDETRVKVEERELAAKRVELARFIYALYSECAAGQELVDVLENAVDELDTLSRTLDARYQMGQATQGERIAMQLQARQARIEQGNLRDRTRSACGKLAEHLDSMESAELLQGVMPKLPDDLDTETLQLMGPASEDVVRAENDMRMARVQRDTSWWQQAAPDFNLGIYRNYYDRIQASPIVPTRNTWTYTVGFTLPLLYPFTDGNDVRKQRAEATIAESRARRGLREAELNRDKAKAAFERSRRVLKQLREHDMPLAEAMVESTFASYKGGKLGFAELLLAKRTWLDLKREDVQLRQTLIEARLNCLSSCDTKDQL